MKFINTKILANGRRRTTVELGPEESIIAVAANGFYRFGAQIDDVVSGYALTEAVQVTWCSVNQKWVGQ